MADKTENTINSEIETLRSELKGLTDSVAGLVRRETENARASAKGFADTVASAAHSVNETGHRIATDAHENVRNVTSQVEACIEKNPLQSVFIAAGVGFVLGLLSRR